jgi:hypothetical protein
MTKDGPFQYVTLEHEALFGTATAGSVSGESVESPTKRQRN